MFAESPRKVKNEDDNNASPEGTASSSKQPRSFDDVLVAMGPPCRYQLMQIAMIMTWNLPMVFVYLKYVFISKESTFRCSTVNETDLLTNHLQTPDGLASYNGSCGIDIFKNQSGMWKSVKTIDCPQGYEFDGDKDASFISEWELVCDKDGIPQLAQTAIAIGAFVGGVIANVIGDKYGRWIMMTGSTVITGGVEIAAAYAPNIYTLISLRFLSGVVCAGMFSASNLIPFEMLVEKNRIIYSAFSGTIWSVHVVIFAGVGYAFRYHGWRDFQFYASLISLYPLLFVYFLNESASWLQSTGKNERCEKILKNACKLNRVNYEDVQNTFNDCCESDIPKVEPNFNGDKVKSYNALDLFRHRNTLVILFITWFVYVTYELTNSGLLLSSSTLAGNHYVNMGILGIMGVPAYFSAWVLMLYMGRRSVIILFTALSGTCLLISALVVYAETDKSVTDKLGLAFFVLGKYAISGAYNTLNFYIQELFPTNLRASGMGIAQTGTSVGAALAPYLLPLSKIASWAPGVILSTGCLLSAILITRLSETRGKKIATTLDR